MQGVPKPHLSLNVSDIDASVAFYEKTFGIQATKHRPGYAKFDLAQPALSLTSEFAGGICVSAPAFIHEAL